MTDFASAFDEGQRAASMAEDARREVDLVFDEVNEQMKSKTSGKLCVERKEVKKPRKNGFGGLWFEAGSRVTYWAIMAKNPQASDPSPREIARWEQDKRGYPCRLIWEGVDKACHDRESLEEAIADLLKDPVVAQTLNTVISTKF